MIKGGIYKTEAVILSTHDFKETSRIVDLYTERWGRFSAVAKGARRKGIFGASLEIFTHVDLVLYLRDGKMNIISQIETINPFMGIREDPCKIAAGCYLIELVKAMVNGTSPDRRLFGLILNGLSWLDEEKRPSRLFLYTISLKTMKALGLGPELGVCVRCRDKLDGIVRFSPKGGGIFCKNCHKDDLIKLSKGTMMVMRRLLELEPRVIRRISITNQMEEELRMAVGSYLEYHLPYRLRSTRVLESLEEYRERI